MDARSKWNRIYGEKVDRGQPSIVLSENADLLPASGRALDIACGNGANSLFLAEHGLQVDAWDISDVVVHRLRAEFSELPINPEVVDIQPALIQPQHYDVIINCHYLDRDLSDAIIAGLKPGGLLMYQTFRVGKQLDFGPSREEFLLADGELQAMFKDLQQERFRDEAKSLDAADKLAGRAYLVARKPAQ